MTRAQIRLADKHGTPEQLKRVILKAHADGFITGKEAKLAILKYQKEWKEAGET